MQVFGYQAVLGVKLECKVVCADGLVVVQNNKVASWAGSHDEADAGFGASAERQPVAWAIFRASGSVCLWRRRPSTGVSGVLIECDALAVFGLFPLYIAWAVRVSIDGFHGSRLPGARRWVHD
jgi:hypothetical protein